MDKPTIGRIVHYVLADGQHRPAIIVGVWPDEFPSNPEEHAGLNLQVFLDGQNDHSARLTPEATTPCPTVDDLAKGTFWVTSAQYRAPTPDGTGMLPGFWHFPEREPAE